jgi:hypothetical protein
MLLGRLSMPQMKGEFSLIQLIGSAFTVTNSWLGGLEHLLRASPQRALLESFTV